MTKLRDQLIIRCLTAAALAFGIFGAVLIHLSFSLQLAQERSSLSERSASLARSAEAAAVNYALQGIPLTDELLAALIPAEDGSCGLYAADGRHIAGLQIQPLPGAGIHTGNRALLLMRPVTLAGDAFTLIVRSDLTPLYRTRSLLLGGYAALYLLMTGLFCFSLRRTARRVVQPVEHLAQTSARLAAGENAVRAEVGGCAETILLAHSFNRMADALTGQIERQQRFIADLTHETKTPLAAIIGHADLIRSGRLTDEEITLAAHRIVREGERLNALTFRLIDLILLKQDPPAFARIYLPSLIEEAAEGLKPLADELGIELTADCTDVFVEGDAALLRVLLNNLIDNALKSDAGHVSIACAPRAIAASGVSPGM